LNLDVFNDVDYQIYDKPLTLTAWLVYIYSCMCFIHTLIYAVNH